MVARSSLPFEPSMNSTKKLYTVLFVLVSTFSFSQQTESLESLNAQIESIRIKSDLIKADSLENEKAIEVGWFKTMKSQLAKLTHKKRKIILEQTGKKWFSIEEFQEMPFEKQQMVLNDANYLIEQNN
jgi:hypothetical protein